MFFIKSKHFNILLLIFLTTFLVNCQKNKVIKSHGIFYLDNRDKLLLVDRTNKNDVIRLLGHPHTKSIKDENTWLYIERTKTRGKLLSLGRDVLLNNNVLVVKFNSYGIIEEKFLYNKEDMNKFKFAEKVTPNDIRKGSFIESFLTSIRQKMYANRKN
tara:strand:+ start:8055 stop:8528 length:474 start_codon:yes stop_codon:yes gene_type:complete